MEKIVTRHALAVKMVESVMIPKGHAFVLQDSWVIYVKLVSIHNFNTHIEKSITTDRIRHYASRHVIYTLG